MVCEAIWEGGSVDTRAPGIREEWRVTEEKKSVNIKVFIRNWTADGDGGMMAMA